MHKWLKESASAACIIRLQYVWVYIPITTSGNTGGALSKLAWKNKTHQLQWRKEGKNASSTNTVYLIAFKISLLL